MKASIAHISQLKTLIQAERDEEITQYEILLKKTTLAERKAKGVTWYPVIISDEEIGIGEQYIIKIEATTADNSIKHHFQSGQSAALFSNAFEGKDRPSLQGVIKKIYKKAIYLVVHTQQLPEWVLDGKLGLDLLYDEGTYKSMEQALDSVQAAKANRLADLRDIFVGKEQALFNRVLPVNNYPQLNKSQQAALNKISQANDIAIIHGPPGTGKTTTLIQAITHTLKTEKQVLVTAPSNTAVDLLTQKLAQKNISVVRLGHPARVNDTLLPLTLDAQISRHVDYKQLQQLRKDAIKLRQQAYKYKRVFGKEQREERKAALAEVRSMLQYARQLERYMMRDVLDKTQVITATLAGSASGLLKERTFETVFIDEAAQALEPATWIPILKCNRVVLAGDHCQLPPTVKSRTAQMGGLMVSLFETCMRNNRSAAVMLNTQYRMHQNIMQYSNASFYKKQLTAHTSVADKRLGAPNSSDMVNSPVNFIDTAGCGFTEMQNPKTLSTKNPQEGDLLLKYLGLLLQQLTDENLSTRKTLQIGIISPYKEQVIYLENALMEHSILQSYKTQISVNTVDGFQGQERDIIAISLVRSNDEGTIGFLSDTRRMNVALTRAKTKLIVVGDSATVASHKFYANMLQYFENINAYKSAWEFMY